jgi:lysophospholipase L1-like esterase
MKVLLFKVLFIYTIVIHVFIALLFYRYDLVSEVKIDLGLQKNDIFKSKYYQNMLVFHSRIDKNSLPGNAIFFGDSIMKGLSVSSVYNPSVNFGIGHDTTEGLFKRLKYFTSLTKSKIIVIAIGVNDINKRSVEEIKVNLAKILDYLPESIPILLADVLPVDELTGVHLNDYNNRIQSLNQEIRKLCTDRHGVYCSGGSQHFVDHYGNLEKQYHIGDGLHLSTDGYKLWTSMLKNKINDILISKNSGDK